MSEEFSVQLGIPITKELIQKFPKEVQQAWKVFDEWWHKQDSWPVKGKNMPEEVQKAFEIMKKAPIPGHEGCTGKDFCYIRGVMNNLI